MKVITNHFSIMRGIWLRGIWAGKRIYEDFGARSRYPREGTIITSRSLLIHAWDTWAPSQYPKRRLSVRSRKTSKPRDLYLELSDRSEIWQALRQQCCRCACQISKRYDNLKYQSRGFEALRDLTERRLFGYWDGALLLVPKSSYKNPCLSAMLPSTPLPRLPREK